MKTDTNADGMLKQTFDAGDVAEHMTTLTAYCAAYEYTLCLLDLPASGRI